MLADILYVGFQTTALKLLQYDDISCYHNKLQHSDNICILNILCYILLLSYYYQYYDLLHVSLQRGHNWPCLTGLITVFVKFWGEKCMYIVHPHNTVFFCIVIFCFWHP